MSGRLRQVLLYNFLSIPIFQMNVSTMVEFTNKVRPGMMVAHIPVSV